LLASYTKPPITEAVIEFRLKGTVSRATIEKARKAIGRSYTREEELKEIKLQFEPGTEKTQVESAFGGKRIYSEDGTDIVWVRPQGLIISRLAPYCGWDAFRTKAHTVWTKWRKIIGTQELERQGLRYINRIDIPVPESGKLRIEDYLRLTPSYPDPDQVFHSYTIQSQVPIGDFRLTINTGSAPPALIGHISYLLDLDVGTDEPPPISEEKQWELLDRMREHKNEVFESYVTDKTRELFR